MGRGLWGNVGTRKAQAGDATQRKADRFRESLKEDNVLLTDIRDEFRRINEERNAERDTAHLHASELCKKEWCPRSSWYRITGADAGEAISPWFVSHYEEGHSIHDRYQTALWRLGVLEGEFRCEACGLVWWDTSPAQCPSATCESSFLKYLEVPIEDDSIMLLGRGDGLAKGRLVEVKSIGEGSLRLEVPGLYRQYADGELTLNQLWRAITRPLPSHIRQVMLYLRARELEQCVVLYEFKANQAQKEFIVRYQPHIIEDIVRQAAMVKKAVEENTIVRRPEWAKENNATCKQCPYRTTCWGVADEPGGEARQKRVRVLSRRTASP